jgi:hypothetical protein
MLGFWRGLFWSLAVNAKRIHQSTQIQQGVCHTVALPFTLKKYLKAKEVLWKLKYFTMENIIFKNTLKENKILQGIIITL